MYYFINTDNIYWKLENDWTRVFLRTVDLYLLNPMFFLDEYNTRGFIEKQSFLSSIDNKYLTTTGLIFQSKKLENHIDVRLVARKLNDYLIGLRYYSRQTNISQSEPLHGLQTYRTLLKTNSLKPLEVYKGTIRKYIHNSRLIKKTIIKADVHSANVEKKTYNEIAIDAIDSYVKGDYKKCILYCSISSEVFLRHLFSDKYQNILAKKSKGYSAVVEPSEKKTKEPIIEHFLKQSRNNYYILLHELPLYVDGFSIMYKYQSLYMHLKRLHEARNLIVHHGTLLDDPTSNKKPLSLTKEGANESFSILKDIFTLYKNPFIDDIDFGMTYFR